MTIDIPLIKIWIPLSINLLSEETVKIKFLTGLGKESMTTLENGVWNIPPGKIPLLKTCYQITIEFDDYTIFIHPNVKCVNVNSEGALEIEGKANIVGNFQERDVSSIYLMFSARDSQVTVGDFLFDDDPVSLEEYLIREKVAKAIFPHLKQRLDDIEQFYSPYLREEFENDLKELISREDTEKKVLDYYNRREIARSLIALDDGETVPVYLYTCLQDLAPKAKVRKFSYLQYNPAGPVILKVKYND